MWFQSPPWLRWVYHLCFTMSEITVWYILLWLTGLSWPGWTWQPTNALPQDMVIKTYVFFRNKTCNKKLTSIQNFEICIFQVQWFFKHWLTLFPAVPYWCLIIDSAINSLILHIERNKLYSICEKEVNQTIRDRFITFVSFFKILNFICKPKN